MINMYEYKVFTMRDTKVSGQFDAASLEDTLNGYAANGWRLTESFLATSLWKSGKAKIFMILEREPRTASEVASHAMADGAGTPPS